VTRCSGAGMAQVVVEESGSSGYQLPTERSGENGEHPRRQQSELGGDCPRDRVGAEDQPRSREGVLNKTVGVKEKRAIVEEES
jgi:hypothetical protein